MTTSQQQEIELYIENALKMLEAAQLMLNNDFYASTINRVYYAIFYAASAVLVTKGLNRGKHSHVISAFRHNFIKTGIFDAKLSDAYGRIMGNRHTSDYDLDSTIARDDAELDLKDAKEFVNAVYQWLKQEDWL